MKSHVQAVVIGGGVVGCSVLYHLTKAGWKDVVLLERDELTSGSSWHAAGGFHTLNGDPNVAKLQSYTVNLYNEIEEISGQSCGLHLTGGVMLAENEARMEWLKTAHARNRYLGIKSELISVADAKALFPLIDESKFVGGLFDPIEGHLDPSGTTHAYAKSARIGGAEIYRHTRVTDLKPRADGTWDVITDKGTIIAEHVVNAGGLWAREVGRMVGLELPVLAMEHMYILTDEIPEIVTYNKESGKELIHIIDFAGEIYTRQEGKGLLLGTYEQDCRPWSPKQTPWDFGHELLEPDLDRIAPSLEIGFEHFPPLERAGIKQVINGPFTFAPDGNPLVGPVGGLPGYWCACAVMAGFSQGGGVGLALSNWMVDGNPGFDVWGMDVARYGNWARPAYTNAKVRENYKRRFRIRFPNEELPAARPLRTLPIHGTLLHHGAVMGDSWGLESPLWYAPPGVEDELSFHHSTDFPHVAAECAAVRDGVGLCDISNFAKYEVTGDGAAAWLSHIMANHLPGEGRIVLSPMLNDKGKLIGDFTIGRPTAVPGEPERFFLFGSGAGETYHMRWFTQHLPDDESVSVRTLGLSLVGLSIAGPRARDVLASATEADVSGTALPFMGIQRIDIGPVPALVGRISYTGDLGYELWVAPDYQQGLFERLMAAGEEFGIRLFGSRALMSLRLEKNFGTWAREFRPIYGPFEAGLGRFVDLSKNDFIGRDAALAEKDAGPEWRLVSFVVEAGDSDALGDEPIWHNGRDGSRVVGWATSGGFAHGGNDDQGVSMAQGYVPAALVDAATGDTAPGEASGGIGGFSIEILGEKRPARIQAKPLFDPSGARMRSG